MSSGVPASTGRLTFARPTAADIDEILAAYASDPDVTRYLVWPTHRSIADTRAFIDFSDAEWARAGTGPLLVRSLDDGRLVGGTGLAVCDDARASTGYVFAQAEWGRGLATETLRVMIDLARTLGIRELDAGCHPAHVISQRVLEKCGFVVDPAFVGETEFPNLVAGIRQPVLRYVLLLA